MRLSIVQIALAEVGTIEDNNDNKQKYGKWLGWDGVPWCLIFLAYVYAMAGHSMGNIAHIKVLAWVPTALKLWTEAGYKTDSPLPGDLAIFNWDKKGDPEHVGMFLFWVVPGKYFMTIEGNIGNGVRIRIRANDETVDGFFNISALPAA